MLPLFLIVFIDLVGFGIMMPLLPYYAQHYGASPARISILFCMYSLGQFFSSPVWGRLSDRHGRKPILILSMAGAIVAYVTIANAESLAWLFVARLFAGLMAGNISTAMAYVSDITTQANRAKGMGLIGAAFGLGFIFGPVIGGVLAGSDPAKADFSTPAYAAAAMSALALAGVALILKESMSAERRKELRENPRANRLVAARQVLRKPGLKRLIMTILLTTTAMAILETSFTIWVNGRFGLGPEMVGYVFAGIGLIMALVQGGAIGPATKRFGETRVLAAGSMLLLLGLVLLPLSSGLAFALAANSLLAVGYGLAQPCFNSLVSKLAAPQETGMVMGVSQSASSLARIVGPLLSSVAFAWLGLDGPFVTGAVIMIPALLAVAKLHAERTGIPARGTIP